MAHLPMATAETMDNRRRNIIILLIATILVAAGVILDVILTGDDKEGPTSTTHRGHRRPSPRCHQRITHLLCQPMALVPALRRRTICELLFK